MAETVSAFCCPSCPGAALPPWPRRGAERIIRRGAEGPRAPLRCARPSHSSGVRQCCFDVSAVRPVSGWPPSGPSPVPLHPAPWPWMRRGLVYQNYTSQISPLPEPGCCLRQRHASRLIVLFDPQPTLVVHFGPFCLLLSFVSSFILLSTFLPTGTRRLLFPVSLFHVFFC